MNVFSTGFRKAIPLGLQTGKKPFQHAKAYSLKKPQPFKLKRINQQEQQKGEALLWAGTAAYLTFCTYALKKEYDRSVADRTDETDEIDGNDDRTPRANQKEFTIAKHNIRISAKKQNPARIVANEISSEQEIQKAIAEIEKLQKEINSNSPVLRALKNPNLKKLQTLDLKTLENCIELISMGISYQKITQAEDTLFASIDAIKEFILNEEDQVKKDHYIAFLQGLENNTSQELHSAIKFKAKLALEEIANND